MWPPPPRLTPLSFFFFLPSRLGGLEDRGRVGSGSTKSSSLSEAESGESENGNRPRASSMSDTPSDQTSDLMVYGAPWIRSGYVSAQTHDGLLAYAHVCASSDKGVCDRVDQFS